MNAATATPQATMRVVDTGPRVLTGLLIPADPARPVLLTAVADASAAISDVLGSVLLDDALTWRTPGGAWVSVYQGEDRATAADNPRLSIIAARLGVTSRCFHGAARGDALLLGTSLTGVDQDLPADVAAQTRRSGVAVQNAADTTDGARRASR